MDPHWRIQYYHTYQDSINYNKVGKLEQFDNDFRFILKQLGIDYTPYYTTEIRHSTQAKQQLTKYYTDALCERVYNIYKIDFDTFNYAQDLPI